MQLCDSKDEFGNEKFGNKKLNFSSRKIKSATECSMLASSNLWCYLIFQLSHNFFPLLIQTLKSEIFLHRSKLVFQLSQKISQQFFRENSSTIEAVNERNCKLNDGRGQWKPLHLFLTCSSSGSAGEDLRLIWNCKTLSFAFPIGISCLLISDKLSPSLMHFGVNT